MAQVWLKELRFATLEEYERCHQEVVHVEKIRMRTPLCPGRVMSPRHTIIFELSLP